MVVPLRAACAQRDAAAAQPGRGVRARASGFVLCLLLSVLLHELGHAVVARRYGIGVRAITLELLGGYTEMESRQPAPAGRPARLAGRPGRLRRCSARPRWAP